MQEYSTDDEDETYNNNKNPCAEGDTVLNDANRCDSPSKETKERRPGTPRMRGAGGNAAREQVQGEDSDLSDGEAEDEAIAPREIADVLRGSGKEYYKTELPHEAPRTESADAAGMAGEESTMAAGSSASGTAPPQQGPRADSVDAPPPAVQGPMKNDSAAESKVSMEDLSQANAARGGSSSHKHSSHG